MLLLFLGASWVNPGSMRWCDTLEKKALALRNEDKAWTTILFPRGPIWRTPPRMSCYTRGLGHWAISPRSWYNYRRATGRFYNSDQVDDINRKTHVLSYVQWADHMNSTDFLCWENTAKLERPCFSPHLQVQHCFQSRICAFASEHSVCVNIDAPSYAERRSMGGVAWSWGLLRD